jgi:hypothetical protein
MRLQIHAKGLQQGAKKVEVAALAPHLPLLRCAYAQPIYDIILFNDFAICF